MGICTIIGHKLSLRLSLSLSWSASGGEGSQR